MALVVRTYSCTGLGFSLTSQVAPGGVVSVAPVEPQLTVAITIDDTVPNVVEDLDTVMFANGWVPS